MEFRRCHQDLAQQRQRDAALVFQRVAVERPEQRHQAAHVARRAGKQVVERFRRQAQASVGGVGAQGVDHLVIGQRVNTVDQPLAESGTQVLAQVQLQRWQAGRRKQAAACGANPVVKVEQRDLPRIAQGFDVVDGVKFQCVLVVRGRVHVCSGQVWIVGRVVVAGTARTQQMGLSRAAVSPKKQ